MNILRGLALGLVAVGATAGAAEAHLATIEVIKNTSAIVAAVYTAGKISYHGWQAMTAWANRHVKDAVREEIEERFLTLACVKTKGLICDKDSGEIE